MQKDSLRIVIFTATLSIICATILAFAYSMWNAKYEENKLKEKYVKILNSFGKDISQEDPFQKVETIYKKNVVESKDAYSFLQDGEIACYGFEVTGPGLWGRMKAFVCLEKNLKTVMSIAFLEQEETPGLGAEILQPFFKDQFKNKELTDENGKRMLFVKKSGAAKGFDIDGITGATITSVGVDEILENTVKKIAKFSKDNVEVK